MKNLTPELIEKAKTAISAEELLKLADGNGIELTEEEAKTYFAQLNANAAVSDDELDAVAGGGSCLGDDEEDDESDSGEKKPKICKNCGRPVYYGIRCKYCSHIVM